MTGKIKRLFFTAFAGYTVINLAITGLYAAIVKELPVRESEYINWPSLFGLELCIFAFSLVLGLIGILSARIRIPAVAKRLVHFVLTMVDAFVFFVVAAGKLSAPREAFIFMLLSAGIYLVILASRGIVSAIVSRKRSDSEKYESKF